MELESVMAIIKGKKEKGRDQYRKGMEGKGMERRVRKDMLREEPLLNDQGTTRARKRDRNTV